MTRTDAALMEGPAFVRAKPLAPLPPPLAQSGAVGWLRENLFSSTLNVALTIVCALLIIWIVPPLVKFLIIDAVWMARPRRLPAAAGSARDRRLLGLRDRPHRLIHLRLLSDRRALAGRLFFALLAVGVVWLAWLDAPRRDLGVIYFFVLMPVVSLSYCSAASDRPVQGGDRIVGRRAGDCRRGVCRHRRLAAARHHAGAGRRSRMPAVRLFSVIFIEFVRGVPLITVLFMASVMLPLFVPDDLVAG